MNSGIRQFLEVYLPGKNDAFVREKLVSIAKERNAEILSKFPQEERPSTESWANSPGKVVEQVSLPGPIVFRYDHRRSAVVRALRLLISASPKDSGLYINSHDIYLNGGKVDRLPMKINTRDEVFIANETPYARRLEVGKRKDGSPFILQKAPHIYENVAKELKRLFSGSVVINFNYASLPGSHTIKGKLRGRYTSKSGLNVARFPKVGTETRAPAIVFRSIWGTI
ncbi:hypothetical protein UFOVP1299_51 [uncultured Caudovirales phage]|uniref:Uncharacterized protein n=1 Tax=uncultured Caudovirales phage TaxID=2100421 RepID=A0A6J5RFK0_9CAUD|nr:hypothetical protein UFOVP1299_51 [uncultured Caudovirales phage]